MFISDDQYYHASTALVLSYPDRVRIEQVDRVRWTLNRELDGIAERLWLSAGNPTFTEGLAKELDLLAEQLAVARSSAETIEDDGARSRELERLDGWERELGAGRNCLATTHHYDKVAFDGELSALLKLANARNIASAREEMKMYRRLVETAGRRHEIPGATEARRITDRLMEEDTSMAGIVKALRTVPVDLAMSRDEELSNLAGSLWFEFNSALSHGLLPLRTKEARYSHRRWRAIIKMRECLRLLRRLTEQVQEKAVRENVTARYRECRERYMKQRSRNLA